MFLSLFLKVIPEKTAFAHCDIPCKIYDPHAAQVAAHSVIRMIQMIDEAKKEELEEKEYLMHIARLTGVKEEHAEIVKREVRIIWGDYFKEEQIKQFPDIHILVHDIMMLASKTKQTLDIESANKLLTKVQEFSEAFYKTKGFEIMRIPSGFPTGGEIVSHK